MKYQQISRITLCVALSTTMSLTSGGLAQQPNKWFKQSHSYRLVISTESGPTSRTAYVEFNSGGRCRSNGLDIAVIDDKGSEVNHRIMTAGPGDKLLVAFSMTDSSDYHVYLGSRAALAPPSNWYPTAGLLLKTYRRPEGSSANVEEFMAMIKKASIFHGAGYRETIFDGYNPFGPSEDYVSVYSGYIRIPKSGEYWFATNSDDSSVLFIDEKPVAEYPGLHGPSAVWGEKNGRLALRAGTHRLDYFHVEYKGGQAAVAG